MIYCCPNCRARLDRDHWTDLQRRDLKGPWAASFEIWQGSCPNCKKALVSVCNRVRSDPVAWVEPAGLVSGRDYDVAYSHAHRRRRWTGGTAVWAWHPLWEFTKYRNAALEQARLHDYRMLILPPGYECESYGFDEVWRVKPHLMEDATGPYPSVRTERAISAALAGRAPNREFRVVHFWPSVMFSHDDYIALGNDEEIAQVWASHSRRKIEIL